MPSKAQQQVIGLIKSLSGQQNILTIPRLFVDLTKNHRTALVLSQCVYWTGKSSLKHGWFYKSYKEWKAELGIPRTSMIRIVENLEENGLIEVKVFKARGAPTCHYRVDMDVLSRSIMRILDRPDSGLSIVPNRDDE